jgi:hypothetical protein
VKCNLKQTTRDRIQPHHADHPQIWCTSTSTVAQAGRRGRITEDILGSGSVAQCQRCFASTSLALHGGVHERPEIHPLHAQRPLEVVEQVRHNGWVQLHSKINLLNVVLDDKALHLGRQPGGLLSPALLASHHPGTKDNGDTAQGLHGSW